MFLWILALGFTSACGANLPDITDRSFIDLCLREHNRARSEVRPRATDMRFMSWDADLAVIARTWARHCVFEHSPLPSQHPGFPSLGENLWVGAPPSYFSVQLAVRGWVNETVDYSYKSNACRESRMCGHYTQVVWARSYKVGCAVHFCSSGIKETSFQSQPGANFVCNYGPAKRLKPQQTGSNPCQVYEKNPICAMWSGNVIGQRPYQTDGDACSQCDPEDSCVERLCRNNGRDAEKSSSSESSASDFVPVLIIRPVALLGSVIAAIAVKHFYPDVFCYE